MDKIVIMSAKRTPIGKLNGVLSNHTAVDLGIHAAKASLSDAHLSPSQIDQVIFGNAIQAGSGQNIARQIEIQSQISKDKTAFTVNQVCGSGLKAVRQAQMALQLGESQMILAGGTESMSNVPFYNINQRRPKKFGSITENDGLERDGLMDAFSNRPMGITAENVARKFNVSRQAQDEFALHSHLKAQIAINQKDFADEIVPLNLRTPKSTITVTQDEPVRFDTTIEKLAALKPVFKPDGTVTAGNAAGLNDGAAALILTTESNAKALGKHPLAEIIDYAEQGIDPSIMGYAPYYAIKKVLAAHQMTTADVDLFEINEAFASQCVAVSRDLNIKDDQLNISGGAIALGHPLGDSGARILTTLVHNLRRTGKTYGIASLCMGGGMGSAMLIKAV